MRLSFSSIKEFDGCPHRFYRTRIIKDVVGTTSYAMRFGDIVHRFIERVFLGKRKRVPIFNAIQDANPLTDLFLKNKADGWETFPEMGFCVRRDWTTMLMTRGDDVVLDVWILGYADLVQVSPDRTSAIVVDWKTGGSRYPDRDQLSLMAMFVMLHFPTVQQVHSSLVFLKDYRSVSTTYFRSNLHIIQQQWVDKANTVENAIASNNLPKTPSVLCPWCPVTDCSYRDEAIILRASKKEKK